MQSHWLRAKSEICRLMQFVTAHTLWLFQNLLLSTGLTSLGRVDGREIASHYSSIALKKWMCTCPNDSIIVINHSTHVICTIWQLLEVFSCFDEWNHSHIPHTLLYCSNTSHTLKHMSQSFIYVSEHSHLLIYNSHAYQLLIYHSYTYSYISHTLNYHSYECNDYHMSFTHLSHT